MRMNIQVDLKENDFLEKGVVKEAKSIARGIAREAMREELVSEIDRIAESKLFDARKGEYYSSVINDVTRAVAKKLSDDIKLDTAAVNDIIEAKVESYINNKMKPYGGMDKFIEAHINKSIAKLLTKE